MSEMFDKVRSTLDEHDEKVDQGIQRDGDTVDERTGGKHSEYVDKGVDAAQQHTGQGDTQP